MAVIRQCQASETCTPPPPPGRICLDSPGWRHNLPNLIPLWAFMINGVTVVWQSAAVAFGFDCQKRERQEKKNPSPSNVSSPTRQAKVLFRSPAEDLRREKAWGRFVKSSHSLRSRFKHLPSLQTRPALPFIFAKRVGRFYDTVHKRLLLFLCFLRDCRTASLDFNNLL